MIPEKKIKKNLQKLLNKFLDIEEIPCSSATF